MRIGRTFTKWSNTGLLLSASLVSSCSREPKKAPLFDPQATALAKQYVAAPIAPNPGMLAKTRDFLVINLGNRVMFIQLPDDANGWFKRATRLDSRLASYGGIQSVIQGPGDFFAVVSVGEGSIPVTVFGWDTVFDVWPAWDYATVQFDEPGERWVGACYATSQVSDLRDEDGNRLTWKHRNTYTGHIWLVPGGGGRLGVLNREKQDDPRPPEVFDPVTRKHLPLATTHTGWNAPELWVDQGHIFAKKGEQVLDYGRLDTVPAIRASEDASRLSPWSVVRSESKVSLSVQSIYRGGPKYTLQRPGRIWTQEVSLYGLHALYDDGDIFDLRTGKLAMTFEFEPGDSGEFLIKLPDGTLSGTKEMLRKRAPKATPNSNKVLSVLRDVLRMRTPERATAYERQIQAKYEAQMMAPGLNSP